MSNFTLNPRPSTAAGAKLGIKCFNWWITSQKPYVDETSKYKGLRQIAGGVQELLQKEPWIIAKYLSYFIRLWRPEMCITAPFDILAQCRQEKGKTYSFIPPPEDVILYKEGTFNTNCSSLLGGLNRMILSIAHKKIEAAQNPDEIEEKWRHPKIINVGEPEYSIYKKTKEIICDLLYDNQIYTNNTNEDKETNSFSPSQVRRVYANINVLTKRTSPMDLLSMIFAQLYLKRFHRGGKELRKYSIKHFHLRKDCNHSRDIKIDYPKGLKNTGRKNKKNKHLKPIYAEKGTLLFSSIAKYMQRRGDHLKSTAFWLQCHSKWKRDKDNNVYGYKDMAIGHNSIQFIFDNLVLKTLEFDNVLWKINKKGKKVRSAYYKIYSFRCSMMSCAAHAGFGTSELQRYSIHTSAAMCDKYIRTHEQNIAKEQTDFMLKSFINTGVRAFVPTGNGKNGLILRNTLVPSTSSQATTSTFIPTQSTEFSGLSLPSLNPPQNWLSSKIQQVAASQSSQPIVVGVTETFDWSANTENEVYNPPNNVHIEHSDRILRSSRIVKVSSDYSDEDSDAIMTVMDTMDLDKNEDPDDNADSAQNVDDLSAYNTDMSSDDGSSDEDEKMQDISKNDAQKEGLLYSPISMKTANPSLRNAAKQAPPPPRPPPPQQEQQQQQQQQQHKQQHKQQPQQWKCLVCTFVNPSTMTCCDMCEADRKSNNNQNNQNDAPPLFRRRRAKKSENNNPTTQPPQNSNSKQNNINVQRAVRHLQGDYIKDSELEIMLSMGIFDEYEKEEQLKQSQQQIQKMEQKIAQLTKANAQQQKEAHKPSKPRPAPKTSEQKANVVNNNNNKNNNNVVNNAQMRYKNNNNNVAMPYENNNNVLVNNEQMRYKNNNNVVNNAQMPYENERHVNNAQMPRGDTTKKSPPKTHPSADILPPQFTNQMNGIYDPQIANSISGISRPQIANPMNGMYGNQFANLMDGGYGIRGTQYGACNANRLMNYYRGPLAQNQQAYSTNGGVFDRLAQMMGVFQNTRNQGRFGGDFHVHF